MRHASVAKIERVPTALHVLLDLVVPRACVACAVPLSRTARDLCAPCRGAMQWLHDTCGRCGLPRPCARRCPAAYAAFDSAWAPLAHEGPARALVLALKHQGRLPLARTMAAHIVAGAPAGVLGEGAALVPVPVDPIRGRRRGFDQAACLARAVGARTALPTAQCLRRTAAPRQVGRGRAARLAAGTALTLHTRGQVPTHAVLIDDVHTTGATLNAAAHALRAAGAERIHAITYTRSL